MYLNQREKQQYFRKNKVLKRIKICEPSNLFQHKFHGTNETP